MLCKCIHSTVWDYFLTFWFTFVRLVNNVQRCFFILKVHTGSSVCKLRWFDVQLLYPNKTFCHITRSLNFTSVFKEIKTPGPGSFGKFLIAQNISAGVEMSPRVNVRATVK